MMEFIKKLIPEQWLKFLRPKYHGFMALFASFYYGRPSEKMIIIGITGTAGKSTTTAMLSHILNFAGKRTGYITTVDFFDCQEHHVNKHGLSMPNEWLLQKQLDLMLANKCHIAIVECTSEGLAQNRHLGINFDVGLFTNLSHAHLETHGSYGNYQTAKGQLFEVLSSGRKKNFFPEKMIGVNFDDALSGFFISFPVDVKFGVTFKGLKGMPAQKIFQAKILKSEPVTQFEVEGVSFSLDLLGGFNAQNASLALSCANMLGVDLSVCSEALKSFKTVRGRMETVANKFGYKIIVDYGCEPASFRAALETATTLPRNNLIHVFGSTGGHRDAAKRFEFGKISAQFSNRIIITNDDVYESSAEEIAKNIEQGVKSFKLRQPEYEIILDRRAAIHKALAIAQKDDIVLITGKGSEQFLVLPGNKRVEWDEVSVVKAELEKLEIDRN